MIGNMYSYADGMGYDVMCQFWTFQWNWQYIYLQEIKCLQNKLISFQLLNGFKAVKLATNYFNFL